MIHQYTTEITSSGMQYQKKNLGKNGEQVMTLTVCHQCPAQNLCQLHRLDSFAVSVFQCFISILDIYWPVWTRTHWQYSSSWEEIDASSLDASPTCNTRPLWSAPAGNLHAEEFCRRQSCRLTSYPAPLISPVTKTHKYEAVSLIPTTGFTGLVKLWRVLNEIWLRGKGSHLHSLIHPVALACLTFQYCWLCWYWFEY